MCLFIIVLLRVFIIIKLLIENLHNLKTSQNIFHLKKNTESKQKSYILISNTQIAH